MENHSKIISKYIENTTFAFLMKTESISINFIIFIETIFLNTSDS